MPAEFRATPDGFVPTAIVLVTVFVDVLITDTVLEPLLATKARVPAGFSAIAEGLVPTEIVLVTVSVAVLLAVTDDDELERLVLAHSPKFQALLDKSRRQIEETGGIPHDVFWREVEAETRRDANKSKQGQRRTKR